MKIELDALLDEVARRHARGEPLEVSELLERAGDRANELAAMIEVFLARTSRSQPSAESLAFVRSLDDPPLLRARVALRLRVDDVVDAIVRACELRPESKGKVRRYYQQLEGGILDPHPVADTVWDAITGLLGRSRAVFSASRGPIVAAAPMYRADRLFEPALVAESRSEPEPPDEVDELFLGPLSSD